MEPLKEMFNEAFFKNFADVFKKCFKAFDAAGFYLDVTTDLDKRALNERMRHTSIMLHKYLPANFETSVRILKDVAPALKTGYTALVFPDYVGLYGKNNFNTSLDALKYFTVFGSSEFAIREFIRMDAKRTITEMEKWTKDINHHVRRLASEGSRPRLPWSFKLDAVIKEPSLTQKILTNLKADDHLYVRKSVANHVNDFSKDHPEYMLTLVSSWDINNPHTRWIIKHACRTLIKKGNPNALRLFDFHESSAVSLSKFTVKPRNLKLGERLSFSFLIKNEETQSSRFVVDYEIAYARPSSTASRKIFKLEELTLQPGEICMVSRDQLFKDFSTRTHHSGRHVVSILVNGKKLGEKVFVLDASQKKV